MKSSSRILGFTLIEMMIVVAVMGTLVSVGVVSYRQFNSKQEMVNSGAELVSILRIAQKKAKSGDKPASCDSGGQTLDGYKVTMYNNLSQVDLIAACSGGDVLDVVYFLPFNIVFSNAYEMTFLVLTAGVQNATSIYIENPNQTHSYGVEVTASGAINNLGMQ